MDAAGGNPEPPVVNIEDFSSDDSDGDAPLGLHPRVNGSGLHDLDALDPSEDDEDSNDEWDIESLLEDTIEEMGDEHLFAEGGKYSERALVSCAMC
jgi:hypothetical protein